MGGSVMDLLDRAEGATRVSPAALGRVLGLDRAPKVKTIRRKLGELAAIGRADQLIMALARHHATARRQENYFRYARTHFALDALDSYAAVPDDPDRLVPSPARKAAAARVRRPGDRDRFRAGAAPDRGPASRDRGPGTGDPGGRRPGAAVRRRRVRRRAVHVQRDVRARPAPGSS